MAHGDSSDIGTILWTIVASTVLLVLIAVGMLHGGASGGAGTQSTPSTTVSTASSHLSPEQRYPIGRFPANVEQMIMQPCEQKTTATFCTCVMSYIESHESVSELVYEVSIWDQSGHEQRLPPTATDAAADCPVL
jgi:hypothetical protein